MKKITRKAVYRERNCDTCGASFLSRSSRKKYCDDCRRKRDMDADRIRARGKLRASGARALGSVVPCGRCGSSFILKVGSQKFCQECSADRFNRWHRESRANCPKKNLTDRIRRSMNNSLARGKQGRSWSALVDYSIEELMTHIERQFLAGMSWDNRDRWHIDHILPIASFSFTSPSDPEFKAAWALSNLRPCWRSENHRKSAKRLFLI